MIDWFAWVQIAVAVAAGLFCVILGLMGRRPSDFSVGALALVEVLLLAQLVVAIVAPFAGNPAEGSLLEFYTYLVAAILIPVGVTAFALFERSRWSTVVLGVGALAIAVMLARMQIIWTVPLG
ncbi:MAG: hypothetical protein GX871_07025 [Microbacteriaceae bacterium]|jgi:hypothetical protein|nr:hypothetical protein [Microbacteriaceae bacterium]HOA86505.1 hypothetical protein [Microbacteriaceae bacterium]HPZ33886.1 hypothetical protein [Microbacteriaceae bacterium]HQC93163.1 hypothetical protein [Microbacteriaceae bacterium]